MATLIEGFNTLMLSQGKTMVSGFTDFQNDVRKNSYSLDRHMVRDGSRLIKGGTTLEDVSYMTRIDGRHVDYNPRAATFAVDNPQPGVAIKCDLRYTTGWMAWDDVEVVKNVSGMTRDSIRSKWKDVKAAKELEFQQGRADHFEGHQWRLPDSDEMEYGNDGLLPYSIPSVINETSDLQQPTGTGITGLHGNWSDSTLYNVDPTVHTNWMNVKQGYGHRGLDNGDGQHLFSALDRAYLKTKFGKIPFFTGADKGGDCQPRYIGCSLDGYSAVQSAYRVNQDWMRLYGEKGNDAEQGSITFGGIPFLYIEELDTAALYADSAAPTVFLEEGSASLGGNGSATSPVGFQGPRYYGVDAYAITKVFDPSRYMEKLPARNPKGNQPYSWIMPCDTHHQTFTHSRRSSFIVTPNDTDLGAI